MVAPEQHLAWSILEDVGCRGTHAMLPQPTVVGDADDYHFRSLDFHLPHNGGSRLTSAQATRL